MLSVGMVVHEYYVEPWDEAAAVQDLDRGPDRWDSLVVVAAAVA